MERDSIGHYYALDFFFLVDGCMPINMSSNYLCVPRYLLSLFALIICSQDLSEKFLTNLGAINAETQNVPKSSEVTVELLDLKTLSMSPPSWLNGHF